MLKMLFSYEEIYIRKPSRIQRSHVNLGLDDYSKVRQTMLQKAEFESSGRKHVRQTFQYD
jgi:hypothetical protein